MPDQAERGIVPVLDQQERALVPAGDPGDGLEFIDHAAIDEYSSLLRDCSMMSADDLTWDNSDSQSNVCAGVPSMMPDQAERGPAAVPGDGLEFLDHIPFDKYFPLPSPCSNDDLLPRTIMPDSRIAWDDAYKFDETEGGDSSANAPLIMPDHGDQDRGMGPAAARSEYLGLHPPHSNNTCHDAMDGAAYKVHDDLLPQTIMPDSLITWDDAFGLDKTEGGDSCADVLEDQGLEFADQVAFDKYFGLHPPHSTMTGADNTYYNAMDAVMHSAGDSVFPPVAMHIPLISWDDIDSSDHKKRKFHESKVGGKLDETVGGNSRAVKKSERIIWSDSGLHEQFVEIVNKLGGVDNAVPSRIVELMDHPGLKIKNVSSHLQKYRNRLKKKSTQQEKAKACVRRFPESYNRQGLHPPPLQESTDLPLVPPMRQQQMNISNATYMEPRQIGAMLDYSSVHEPISGRLYGLATHVPQQRQNDFPPEQQSIGHLHGNISERSSRHRMLPDDQGHVNMGITGTERQYLGFPAVVSNVNSYDERDGNLRTHASSLGALENATSENGVNTLR